MFTSDKAPVWAWLVASACALGASRIYALFSHGVSSPFMTWMFLVPLIGGVAVFAVLRTAAPGLRDRMAFNAYNSGLATLAVASTLQGVFEIAGTASPYVAVFVAAGAGLVAFAIGRVAWKTWQSRRLRTSEAPA